MKVHVQAQQREARPSVQARIAVACAYGASARVSSGIASVRLRSIKAGSVWRPRGGVWPRSGQSGRSGHGLSGRFIASSVGHWSVGHWSRGGRSVSASDKASDKWISASVTYQHNIPAQYTSVCTYAHTHIYIIKSHGKLATGQFGIVLSFPV